MGQWGNGFGPVWAACVGVGFHELGSLGATKKWIWVLDRLDHFVLITRVRRWPQGRDVSGELHKGVAAYSRF